MEFPMAKPKKRVHIPPLSPEEAYDLMKNLDEVVRKFDGNDEATLRIMWPLLGCGAESRRRGDGRRSAALRPRDRW